MILYFDLTDASKRRISVYKALGSINSSLIISASHRVCRCCPAVRRSCGVCRGRLLIFYTFYITYTIYTLIFCAIIQFKKIFEKSIDICEKA